MDFFPLDEIVMKSVGVVWWGKGKGQLKDMILYE